MDNDYGRPRYENGEERIDRGLNPMGVPRQPYSNIITAAHGNRLAFIQRVYLTLLGSILFAIAAGWFTLNTPGQAYQLQDGSTVVLPAGVVFADNFRLFIWIALFALIWIAGRVGRNPAVGGVLLLAFTGLAGVWVAPNIWFVGVAQGSPELVALAGALTAVMFVTLTVYAWLSKKDFSFLGAGLWVAFIGIMAAGFLNMLFFHSAWALTIIAWAILMFASAGVLYSTSVIMRRLPEDAYVYGAIMLFVDILNMFLAILSILSGGRR